MFDTSLNTMHDTYAEICAGETPWVALGNFMNDFFGYAPDRRVELLYDAVSVPLHASLEHQRWAIFCAASVEYLSKKYLLPCPDWVHDAHYAPLAEPWFLGIGAKRIAVQERLKQETPPEFARKNVFCGDRVYSNKYESAALYRREKLQPAKYA
jgi:hypothetical protein